MLNLINIQGNSPLLFAVTFEIAILVLIATFIIDSYRKKYPFIISILIAYSLLIIYFIGFKVGTFNNYSNAISYLIKPDTAFIRGKNGAMGMFIVIPVLILIIRFLKIKLHILNSLAFGIPIAMFIQRWGCLFNGCCYGIYCQYPWAIQYGNHSEVWHDHVSLGLINELSSYSLPIHPIPLYFMLSSLIVIIILIAFNKIINTSSNNFLVSITLLVLFRFIIEFFRESKTNALLGSPFMHLKLIQWILLFLGILGLIITFYRFKHIKSPYTFHIKVYNNRITLIFILVTFLTFYYFRSFTIIEKFTLLLFYSILGSTILLKLIKYLISNPYKYVYLGIAVSVFLFMGQYSPEKTYEESKLIDNYSTLSTKYNWGNLAYEVTISEGCYNSEVINSSGYYGGIEVQNDYHKIYNNNKRIITSYGLRINSSNVNSISSSYGSSYSDKLFWSLSYNRKHIWPYFGIGYGGSIATIPANDKAKLIVVPMPYTYIRTGYLNYIFIESGLADFSLAPFPFIYSGIGSNFGLNKEVGIRLGYGTGNSIYGKLDFPIHNNININFSYFDGKAANTEKLSSFNAGLTFKINSKIEKQNK